MEKTKMTISDKEKVITFLISKFKDSKNNEISISKNDIDIIKLTEQEIIQCLYLLQSDNLLIIKVKSIHDDFSRFWTVELNSSCIFYFENKKLNTVSNKREWVRTYIPISISLIALIRSFLPEITLLIRELLQLLK